MPGLMEGRIVSATQVRSNFFQLLEEVREGNAIVIHQATRDGDVMMVPRNLLIKIIGAVTMCAAHTDDEQWRSLIERIWGRTGVPESVAKGEHQEVESR